VNALVVMVVEVALVVVLVVVIVNFSDGESGCGNCVSVHHQHRHHYHYAMIEAVTFCQFPVFSNVCLFCPLARSSLIPMALPISSCQFILGLQYNWPNLLIGDHDLHSREYYMW
jgi:hypothetical protein